MSEATEIKLTDIENRYLSLINLEFKFDEIDTKVQEFKSIGDDVEHEADFNDADYIELRKLIHRMEVRFNAKLDRLRHEHDKNSDTYISEQQNRANAVLINYSRFLESKNCRGLDLDKVNEFIKTI